MVKSPRFCGKLNKTTFQRWEKSPHLHARLIWLERLHTVLHNNMLEFWQKFFPEMEKNGEKLNQPKVMIPTALL